MSRRGRTALYRVYDADKALLYIGISKNFGQRWTAHASIQPWWPEAKTQTIEWFDSRPEAEAAEKAAIKAEKPKYNKDHVGASPFLFPEVIPYPKTSRSPGVTTPDHPWPIGPRPQPVRPSSTSVPCRQCGAQPGARCVTATGNICMSYFHIERIHDLPREGNFPPGKCARSPAVEAAALSAWYEN